MPRMSPRDESSPMLVEIRPDGSAEAHHAECRRGGALQVDDTEGRDDIPDRGSEKRVEIQLRLQEGCEGSHAPSSVLLS